MASTSQPTEDWLIEAADRWDLESLYDALAAAKTRETPYKRKGLTKTEKRYLRGLLSGHSPDEIAQKLDKHPGTVRESLCENLYPYINKLTGKKVKNWRDVIDLLDAAGYRKQLSSQSQPATLPKLTEHQEQTSTVSILQRLNCVPLKEPEKSCSGLYIPNTRCRTIWGRDDLVENILERLVNPKELSIFCLWGGPGYGKTELAVQVAKEALRRSLFADVLWVTARASEFIEGQIVQTKLSKDFTLRKFLNEIADQLGCSAKQVKQCIKKENLLVVLDNAETSDMGNILANLVLMLNPSRALLTSRIRTKPQYVGVIETKGLAEEWVYQLLHDEAEYNNIQVLLQASEEQLHQIYELSCGAPLALHFIAGRAFHDRALEPVLSELNQAGKRVEVFYQFCIETAWRRITDIARNVLRHVGHIADAGITWTELSGAVGVQESQLNEVIAQLRQWYLLEDIQDAQGTPRIDLHPWVRNSVRSGLVDKWQPSPEYLEQIAKLKREQITWNRSLGRNGL